MADQQNCLELAINAARGLLSEQEVAKAFEDEAAIRDRLIRYGKVDNLDQRVADEIVRRAAQAKWAAMSQKIRTQENVRIRAENNAQIDRFIAGGLKPWKTVRALAEGTELGVTNAGDSAYAKTIATRIRYLGPIDEFLSRNRDIAALVNSVDQNFDDAFAIEAKEVTKANGNPGVTGNQQALALARVLMGQAEVARVDHNARGAMIGKLDGWGGPQWHNDMNMIHAGRDNWVNTALAVFDNENTFPDVMPDDIATKRSILEKMYDKITLGDAPDTLPDEPKYQGPSNSFTRLNKHRYLHFTDAEAMIAYKRAGFTHESIIGATLRHIERMADNLGITEKFSSNPEYHFKTLLADTQEKMRASGRYTQSQIGRLSAEHNDFTIRQLTHRTGMVDSPTLAMIGSSIRVGQKWSKLGGVLGTSVPSDTAAAIFTQLNRGVPLLKAIADQLSETGRQFGVDEKVVAGYASEAFEALHSPAARFDAGSEVRPGWVSKVTDWWFKWNGLEWWTLSQRQATGRVTALQLAEETTKRFDALHPRYRNVLDYHGIDQTMWNVIREASFREANGRNYITPDAIRAIPDETVGNIIGTTNGAKIARFKFDTEMKLAQYFAAENRYAMPEPDWKTDRLMTLNMGKRPGTYGGEAIKMVMQFKAWPLSWGHRVLGRAFYGQQGATGLERALANKWHIGSLLAGMTIAGYSAMTIKDMIRGNWPPRDPTDPSVAIAALLQGGALGIYGDYLFASQNRFGSSVLASTMGPAVSSLVEPGLKYYAQAKDAVLLGDVSPPKARPLLDFTLSNTPFYSHILIKPAVDILFMNSLREAMDPGYLNRVRSRRMREYGQNPVLTLDDLTR